MPVHLTDAQWAAARTLAEGALPTHARIAAILDVDFRRAAVRRAQAEVVRFASGDDVAKGEVR